MACPMFTSGTTEWPPIAPDGVVSVPLPPEHGAPGSLVGNVLVVDRESLVTPAFIVRGDHLPILASLAASQTSALEPPHAMVWGVDLGAASSRRAAHKQLRLACRDVLGVATAHETLAHLFVVYTHGAALLEGTCLTAAGQVAAKLHAELERARGRFVEVILIDATGWEDEVALRDRIVQTVATPAGVAGDVALGWHSLTDASIHQAAMEQLC